MIVTARSFEEEKDANITLTSILLGYLKVRKFCAGKYVRGADLYLRELWRQGEEGPVSQIGDPTRPRVQRKWASSIYFASITS